MLRKMIKNPEMGLIETMGARILKFFNNSDNFPEKIYKNNYFEKKMFLCVNFFWVEKKNIFQKKISRTNF